MNANCKIALVLTAGLGLCISAAHSLNAQVNPPPSRAQQQSLPVIGVLTAVPFSAIPHLALAFHRGLKETGYVEDWNVKVDYRSAQDQYSRLPALATELVGRQVKVIVAFGPPTARAAKAATQTIPIVFTSGGDVVKSGLVTSLSRPGGNATGVNLFTQDVEGKKLEQLSRLNMGEVGTTGRSTRTPSLSIRGRSTRTTAV